MFGVAIFSYYFYFCNFLFFISIGTLLSVRMQANKLNFIFGERCMHVFLKSELVASSCLWIEGEQMKSFRGWPNNSTLLYQKFQQL